jgi:hypothetical protein
MLPKAEPDHRSTHRSRNQAARGGDERRAQADRPGTLSFSHPCWRPGVAEGAATQYITAVATDTRVENVRCCDDSEKPRRRDGDPAEKLGFANAKEA